MSITGATTVSALSALYSQNSTQKVDNNPQAQTQAKGPSFSDRIGNAVDQLVDAQKTANASARDFEMGRTEDLAAVMVDQQVASLGFQMTLSVRNKALTAYRDIMNMPV